ncbi:MAG: hypothetical protein KDJ69_11050, partial [Nitratireductor sp.]|nr:hypothetical protein [Nitratireductor sp.]
RPQMFSPIRRSILYLDDTRLLIAVSFNGLQRRMIASLQGNAPSSAGRFHRLTEPAAHVLQPNSRDTLKKNRAKCPAPARR